MNPKDSFLQKIQPMKNIQSLLDQQNRFKADPGPSKTIGCLVVSSTILSLPYLHSSVDKKGLKIPKGNLNP